ncbi:MULTISPECIES: hypothetical protein [Janthinobacterium]|uniref:hypothetical protein n=1 Tax=Janthinobacterium TaxID=29580 RepID=UPI000AA9AC08|nr:MULTISPECIES: hypothetical protein [Janthinobacterium]MBW3507774.1 hypothetical protein [Janthinobacterium sp. NKUCC06_STL]MCA1860651.1 hypothetical protein [Janthinobacterium lividum]MDN2670954.1 hypothetical protein [Janthinobacterium sp. SUN026]MDN2677034.1 hypothetical protein [Janthinobacterium sp. SUN033]MDN2701967.1 hypothetical protein [Janthinobacterium sp. SUN100]
MNNLPLQAKAVQRSPSISAISQGVAPSGITCTLCKAACGALSGTAQQLCLMACNATVC